MNEFLNTNITSPGGGNKKTIEKIQNKMMPDNLNYKKPSSHGRVIRKSAQASNSQKNVEENNYTQK